MNPQAAPGAPPLRFAEPLRCATFVARPTRFTGIIRIDGRLSAAHINSSGRMQELLVPGRVVGVTPARPRSTRRSEWNLHAVRHRGAWCNIDSALPNRLLAWWLEHRALPQLEPYISVRREVRCGDSRLDFLLEHPAAPCFVEVKSVTLAIGHYGLFPDAPSERAVRHVHTLIDVVRQGARAAIVFIMPHPRMRRCWANPVTDPQFASAVEQARDAGVMLLAIQARLTRKEVRLAGARPVLPPDTRTLRALKAHVTRWARQPVTWKASRDAGLGGRPPRQLPKPQRR